MLESVRAVAAGQEWHDSNKGSQIIPPSHLKVCYALMMLSCTLIMLSSMLSWLHLVPSGAGAPTQSRGATSRRLGTWRRSAGSEQPRRASRGSIAAVPTYWDAAVAPLNP